MLRFHILRPGISHIVSIYPLLPYLGFYLLCSPSLPLYSSIRFLRFAPLRPQRPVAVFLSRYTLVPSVGRCYSKFLSLSRVPRALISGNGDERLRISYMFLVYLLLVSSKRTLFCAFIYCFFFLSFSASFYIFIKSDSHSNKEIWFRLCHRLTWSKSYIFRLHKKQGFLFISKWT